MRKRYISQTLTATGTGTDETTRWTVLAKDAAAKIKAVLDAELTGFTPMSSSYIGGDNYETQLTYKNTALGYELVVGVRGENYRFGIVYYIKYGGRELISQTCNYNAIASRTSGNTVAADFRVAVYNIDDIIWLVGVERYSGYNNYGSYYYTGTFHISFTAFKGSYDDETYVMYRATDDYSTKIKNLDVSILRINYSDGSFTYGMHTIRASDGAKNINGYSFYDKSGNGFISYSRTGFMPAPKTGYFLYPHYWYGTFDNADGEAKTNFGLALFGGDKVLYVLRDASTNDMVTTGPDLVYTVNGKEYLAVTNRLIIAADPPLRKYQKPGEVLTW